MWAHENLRRLETTGSGREQLRGSVVKGKTTGSANGRHDVAVLTAHTLEGGGAIGRHEVVNGVPAQQGEMELRRQLVPQFLEGDGALRVAGFAEQVHDFAIRADDAVSPSGPIDHVRDDGAKVAAVRPTIHDEACQQLLGVENGEAPVFLKRIDCEAAVHKVFDKQCQVVTRGEDDGGLSGAQALGQECSDHSAKVGAVLVKVDGVRRSMNDPRKPIAAKARPQARVDA
jgi:hypothetical protein